MTGGQSATTAAPVVRRLGAMIGQPVRITILDRQSQERVARVLGVLSGVDENGLSVQCLLLLPPISEGTQVTLEVISGGNLSWGYSYVDSSDRGVLRLSLPTTVQGAQRRRYPRVDLDLPVHVITASDERSFHASIRDLSAGGASIRAREPLEAGERVTLMFTLGSGLFFQDLEAEVVRSVEAGEGVCVIGLRFLCGREQEAVLASWVNRQLDGFFANDQKAAAGSQDS